MKNALSTGNNMRTALGAAVLAIALLFALAACADDSESEPTTPTQAPSTAASSSETQPAPATAVPQETDKVSVVTTTNIMADWVSNVAGDSVEVCSLGPIGADPHTFQPGARDVARIAEADLVLSVGLGLEGE